LFGFFCSLRVVLNPSSFFEETFQGSPLTPETRSQICTQFFLDFFSLRLFGTQPIPLVTKGKSLWSALLSVTLVRSSLFRRHRVVPTLSPYLARTITFGPCLSISPYPCFFVKRSSTPRQAVHACCSSLSTLLLFPLGEFVDVGLELRVTLQGFPPT